MEPQSKLHLTCRCSGGQCRDSSRSRGTNAVIGEAKVCSVEQVEELGAELHTECLVDVEVLVQAGINRLIAWPDENVASGITKGVLSLRVFEAAYVVVRRQCSLTAGLIPIAQSIRPKECARVE